MILRHLFDFPWAVDDDDEVDPPAEGPQHPYGPKDASPAGAS